MYGEDIIGINGGGKNKCIVFGEKKPSIFKRMVLIIFERLKHNTDKYFSRLSSVKL
jgi:hypothetical protein